MTRIRIRTRLVESEKVDSPSFKLGYQQGFREAEEVTIKLLDELHITPLQNDLQKKNKQIKYLENKINSLEMHMENINKSQYSHGGLLPKNSLSNDIFKEEILGLENIHIDLTKGRDRTVTGRINSIMTSAEERNKELTNILRSSYSQKVDMELLERMRIIQAIKGNENEEKN